MKKDLTEEKAKHIFGLLNELTKAERSRSVEIIHEVEEYLEETDFESKEVVKINTLIGLARYHINGRDANAAEDVLQRALQIAEEINDPDEIFHVQSTLAITYSMRGDHLKAINIWEDMLTQVDKDSTSWISLTNNLVVAYGFTKQFIRAVDLCFELLEEMERRNVDPDDMVPAYINLGNAYGPLRSFDKSLKAYQKALELAIETKNLPYQSYVYGNMARVHADLEDYEQSYDCAMKALEISRNYYGESHIADTLSTVASACVKLGRFDEAKQHLDEALSIIDAETDVMGYTNILVIMSTLMMKQGQYEEAIKPLNEAEMLSKDSDVLQIKVTIRKLFNEYYVAKEDFKNANKAMNELLDLQEEQYKDISERMISKQEAEYLRRKIEEQKESYRHKNEELEKSNKLIKKQSRQLVKSNRELEASLSMLNRLISILSHDVRGPAANSAAALDLILDGSIGKDAVNDLISHVKDNLDAVTDLLAEMMLWIESRSFRKDVDRLMQNVAVKSLLEQVVKFSRGQVHQKQIQVNLQCEPDTIKSYTEPNILKIVLRNILSNAIKYSHQGGTIDITCEQQPKYVELCIRDNGIGMSKKEVASLLKEKSKPREGTNQEMGMGMGLRLCLGYLKILGVDYEINSEEQKGTEFVLYLQKAKKT
ncbi:MAG: tetratricopeptide repeat protein [Candidatus Cloacimonetes bacterium]|jgi:signal transduction histidine kinase|nr:tetratricopeptide repeat protein [Candidatus Cloacimonadota bacterium]MDD2506589.1 tetratricopeptide repeat protein [Candidatus Cloacimonadota bacterium]MDD4147055.1 tetratricopeptide repeat protein [Candidatus Cloacimonadota bacterium]MDD4560209.1 tetratricopeptide repeat protein [Candidatus Cloacimonadota bacterium]